MQSLPEKTGYKYSSYYNLWEGSDISSSGSIYYDDSNSEIIIWQNSENKPSVATYSKNSGGEGTKWIFDDEYLKMTFKKHLELCGVENIDTSNIDVDKIKAAEDKHFYKMYYRQKYGRKNIYVPIFMMAHDGDNSEISLLGVGKFCKNINDINCVFNDLKLKEIAYDYFQSRSGVYSFPEKDDLTVGHFVIIKDKLCKKVGSAIIDKEGSKLFVYIDIQIGNVIWEFIDYAY